MVRIVELLDLQMETPIVPTAEDVKDAVFKLLGNILHMCVLSRYNVPRSPQLAQLCIGKVDCETMTRKELTRQLESSLGA